MESVEPLGMEHQGTERYRKNIRLQEVQERVQDRIFLFYDGTR